MSLLDVIREPRSCIMVEPSRVSSDRGRGVFLLDEEDERFRSLWRLAELVGMVS